MYTCICVCICICICRVRILASALLNGLLGWQESQPNQILPPTNPAAEKLEFVLSQFRVRNGQICCGIKWMWWIWFDLIKGGEKYVHIGFVRHMQRHMSVSKWRKKWYFLLQNWPKLMIFSDRISKHSAEAWFELPYFAKLHTITLLPLRIALHSLLAYSTVFHCFALQCIVLHNPLSGRVYCKVVLCNKVCSYALLCWLTDWLTPPFFVNYSFPALLTRSALSYHLIWRNTLQNLDKYTF